MQVTIHLVGALHEYIPDGKERMALTVNEGSTVRQALLQARVPAELVKTVLVDGERSNMEKQLADGQEITVMALIGGGCSV